MSSFDYFYTTGSCVQQIEFDQINNLKDDKLFVCVGGGIATGKTYVIEQAKLGLPVVDVDECVKEIGKGKYDRLNLAAGRMLFSELLEEAYESNESFIYVGTNANLNGVKKRLLRAKESNYTNVLVHVEASLESAVRHSNQRVVLGERNEISIDRIEQTINDSFSVFNELKNNPTLVDFYTTVRTK